MIKFEGVHKSFGDLRVLRGVDLEIPTGTVTVVCGWSGCGKTTLLRCANGLERADRGRIDVDGTHVNGNGGLRELRARVGIVFQERSLYSHLSILDNVSLALRYVRGLPRKQAAAAATAYLEMVGIAEKAGALPARLSGGQQQRAAIARALAMEPAVLLIDEPTSSLDPDNVSEVLDVLTRLAAEGRTMLITTHQFVFARHVANRAALLDGGRIVEEAPPVEFFDNPQHERTQRFLKRYRQLTAR